MTACTYKWKNENGWRDEHVNALKQSKTWKAKAKQKRTWKEQWEQKCTTSKTKLKRNEQHEKILVEKQELHKIWKT